MWKFLFVCALAVSVQGRTVLQTEKLELLKDLRALLRAKSDIGSSETVSASNEESNAISAEKSMTDLIKEKYGDLFTTMAAYVEDGTTVAEPIAYVIEKLNAGRPSIVPCLDVAQLIGALRYAMVHELQPGMYYTLRGFLEKSMMETGHVIDLNATLFRNIGHAVLKPVFDALEELECDIGIATNCPASVSDMLPRPSPMVELYRETKSFMEKVDFTTTPVGIVIAGFMENIWMKFLNEKFPDSYTCDNGIDQVAISKLETAVDNMNIASAQDELRTRLGSIITDEDLVDDLTNLIITEHFVDNYQAMRDMKDLLKEARSNGLNTATSALNGHVISMIYESIRDEKLFDLVLKNVMEAMDYNTLNRPLHELPVEDIVKGQYMILDYVMRHWKTPCLNARLIGMLAGFMEVQRAGALKNPRVAEWFRSIVKEFGLSIMDKDVKIVFDEIMDITLEQPFKPFIDEVLKIAGHQPTELTFIDLYERLSKVDSSMSVEEGIHLVLSTIVPLMRHDAGSNDSPFTCEVSMEGVLKVLNKAHGIVDNLKNEDSMVAAIKDTLSRLPTVSSIPEDTLNAFATRLIEELKREVLGEVMSGLTMLQVGTETDAVETLTNYLAATIGFSIKYFVDTNRNPTPVVSVPAPTNPTEFVAWQNKLVSNFVSQYVNGIAQYNMIAKKHIDICTALPQLCNALSQDLPSRPNY